MACGVLGARVESLAVFGGFVSYSVANDRNPRCLVRLLLAKETYRIFNLFWHDKLIILEIFATEINSDELIHLAKHAQFCVKSRIDLYLCH